MWSRKVLILMGTIITCITLLIVGLTLAIVKSQRSSSDDLIVDGLPANNPMKEPWIWPLPQTWQRGNKTIQIHEDVCFDFNNRNVILTEGVQRYRKLFFLKEDHPMIPFNWSATEGSVTGQVRLISVDVENTSETLDIDTDQSYSLVISTIHTKSVSIKAKTVYGALYALETLSQLVRWSSTHRVFVIPNVPWNITDSPKYKHRGLLLDTSRHYYAINDLYKVIDTMSWNKMNVFHWHLLDATSFPYVSRAYPQLAAKGAYSPAHQYTTSQILDLVQYAKQRGVRVLPELEAPGHSTSWAYG